MKAREYWRKAMDRDTDAVSMNLRSAMVHSDNWGGLDVPERVRFGSIADALARVLTMEPAHQAESWDVIALLAAQAGSQTRRTAGVAAALDEAAKVLPKPLARACRSVSATKRQKPQEGR